MPEADYADLFTVISDRVVRRPGLPVCGCVYGLLEARLQSVDRVILGALVEYGHRRRAATLAQPPMRDVLGLDLPERRISLSAHDFAQALGTGEVILACRPSS